MKTPPDQGSCCMVGVVTSRREETSQGTQPFFYATDEVSNLGLAGFIQPPPELHLLVLKRLRRKEVGYEVLYNQPIIFVCFRPPLSIFLFKHSQGFSDDQVPRNPNFWGPMDKYFPLIILWRRLTNLSRDSGLTVQKRST